MLTRDGKHLRVFEDFVLDRTLPKWKGKKTRSGVILQGSQGTWDGDIEDSGEAPSENDDIVMGGIFTVDDGNVVMGSTSRKKPRGWGRLRFWKNKPKAVKITMTIADFFRSVHDGAEQLALADKRAEGYAAAIKATVVSGQTAFREKLVKNLVAVRAETRLLAMGLTRYLREETVVEFVKKCPKGLRFDFIANFARVIPADLLALKAKADEHGIFDNYAVLHYDPQGKSWAETEKEKAKRKDPILFGLIDGRRLLYYIGDWTDEFCDLTLDQIADVLGKSCVGQIPEDVGPDIREAAGTGPARETGKIEETA
jgi:hypothetical protein